MPFNALQEQFKGHRLLALSWVNGHAPKDENLAFLKNWTILRNANSLLACDKPECLARGDNGDVAIKPTMIVHRPDGIGISATDLLKEAFFLESFGEYSAPAICFQQGQDALRAYTDNAGLGQVFTYQGDDFAAISTSSTLLGQISGVSLNHSALASFALVGSYTEQDTAFEGVAKLAAGHYAELQHGKFRTTPWAKPSIPKTEDDLPAQFSDCVEQMTSAFPDAALELSGGLDSRLILAAVPHEKRKYLHAITIGDENSPDVIIANKIAAQNNMQHDIVKAGVFSDFNASGLAKLVDPIAMGYDHAANPVDKSAIILAERSIDTSARFSGQNGEILRGFYYPMQPLNAEPSPRLAQRLIDWRLINNDRVSPDLTDTELFAQYEAETRRRLENRLLSFSGKWGEVLDRYYVYERMQRWTGAACGSQYLTRTILYPFFNDAFMQNAFALPPSLKNGSAIAFQLLKQFDPVLACIPLDTGVVPADYGTWRMKLAAARQFKDKAIKKVGSRLRRSSQPTLGSGELTMAWHGHKLYQDLPYDKLLKTGLLKPAALDKIMSGEIVPDRPTLGFLLLLSSLVELDTISLYSDVDH